MTSATYWYLVFAVAGIVAAWAVIKGMSDD
jgi:hypothetical protein